MIEYIMELKCIYQLRWSLWGRERVLVEMGPGKKRRIVVQLKNEINS